MNQPLLPTIGMGHVVDQFHVVDLVEAISRHDLMTADNPSPVGSGELGLLAHFLPHIVPGQRFQHRVEDIEDQPPALHQVTVNAL